MTLKERPILFSAPMVRAILDGRKTQTRRAFSDKLKFNLDCAARIGEISFFIDEQRLGKNDLGYVLDFCPYGQPRDRLWVRETWMPDPSCDDDAWDDAAISWHEWDGCGMPMRDYPDALKTASNVIHRASWDGQEMVGWKPSIHMPRWASRILIEIVSVRVERLNDISESDAKAEGLLEWGGVETHPASRPNCPQWRWYETAADAFKNLWQSINGAESWQANPWVWVIEFKRVEQ